MSKHTPGPWKVTKAACSDDHRHYIHSVDTGYIVAATSRDIAEKGTIEANAHLIAAAPEMLDAIIAMHMWCECNHVVIGTPAFMERIKSVITKARGN